MAQSNRSRLLAAAALAVAGVTFLAVVGGPAVAAGRSVAIKDGSFSPATITIRAGDTITWTNRGYLVHNVIFASFGSKMYMDPGERYGHTFSRAGTYAYACTLHDIRGKVVVTGALTPKPTRKPTPKPAPATTATPSPSPSPTPTPTPSPSPSASPSPTPTPTPVPSIVGPTTPTTDSGGLPIAIVVAVVVAGLVGVGTVVARRR
jgi:plastocyanin